MSKVILVLAAIVLLSLSCLTQADVTNMGPGLKSLELVYVTDAGNPADAVTGYGSVNYEYMIGKYEVTAAQYCEFLNAKAKTDQAIHDGGLGLWPQGRWTEVSVVQYGNYVVRSGGGTEADPWVFTVAADWANRPMNYVSYWNALRFANWLHNGQGDGDTETGAYIIPDRYTGNDATGNSIVRNPNAIWTVTNENEWYKAAYYNPFKPAYYVGEELISAAGYYRFATMNDWTPNNGTAEIPIVDGFVDPGNYANHGRDWPTTWIPFGFPYYRTIVGEFENSHSYYGTFDQAANVQEWTESILGNNRILRGGSRPPSDQSWMQATNRQNMDPAYVDWGTGFRVCCLVIPEPPDVTNMGPGLTSLDLVTIGDAGNPPDSMYGYGSVDYEYKIGKYEVTTAQYCVFLNAKAKIAGNLTDSLFALRWGTSGDPMMQYNPGACLIVRTGGGTAESPYIYTVEADWANRPVNYVSFMSAIRFANWLHNGQGNGDTETGAYTITEDGINNNTIFRNTNWNWALASEDEWYKAAYYEPGKPAYYSPEPPYDLLSPVGYWQYPTRSNAHPSNVGIIDGFTDPGNFALYDVAIPTYGRTVVGEFENSASYYGTFDQGANVWEINDTIIGAVRGCRGSGYNTSDWDAMARFGNRIGYTPYYASAPEMGFRIVKKPDAVISSLTCTVNLLDFVGDKTTIPVMVTVGATDYPLNLDGNGEFTIVDLVDGTYDVRIKASHWLARIVPGVVVSGATSIGVIDLINGDVIDNNEVDFSDINATRAAYGSFPGDETWNELADVDGTGEVDFTDINIVRSKYGEIGE